MRIMKLDMGRTDTSEGTMSVVVGMVRRTLNQYGVNNETEVTPDVIRLMLDLAVAQAHVEAANAITRLVNSQTVNADDEGPTA